MPDSTTLQKSITSMDVRSLMAYLLLSVVYIVSGKLGLMLALPPGYASPIFPPAGIAVAAVLIGGKRTLPWIFIGSLLLNIWVGYSSSGQINAMALSIATLIAIASMLQAAIGGCGLRRMIGYPAALDNSGDVLRFLITAPVICLTSATLSVGGLWALGVVDKADFATNWASWWVGDTLGVIVMLPLAMIAAGEPRMLWKNRIRSVAVPISLIFALFILIFLEVNRWEYNDSLMEFRQLSQRAVSQVQNKLEEQEFLLEQTASLFAHDSGDRITRDEFHRFVEKSLIRFPMIQALEWAAPVDAAQRAAFEASQRNNVPGFEIRERDAAGKMVRAGKRSTYYPVTYIEPFAGNEAALGFDLASNPKRMAALTEAIMCGTTVLSRPLHLVQERRQQAGVLLIMAVDPHNKQAGMVLTVLRVGDFMDKLLKDMRPMLDTRLIDLDDHNVIYDNFTSAAQLPLYQRTFDFGTRHYRLETAPTPAYFAQHHGWQSWWVLAVGILGTGLIGALLLLGTGYTARIEAQVDQRTRELTESKKRLQEAQHLAQIGSWELDIVENALIWSDEIYRIFEIDPAAFGASYQAFLNAIHPEDRAMVDSAYAESVKNRTAYSIEHRLLFPDGRVKFVHERGETSYDSQGIAIRSAGTVQDITSRKLVEAQLSRRLRHRDIMERITRISLNSIDIEELLKEVLDEILTVFNADRAWFLYPCDPDAPSWSVPMERTRPEWPGAFALGKAIPMNLEVAEVFRELLTFTEPLPYGPAALRSIPAAVAEQFSIRSQIQMALRPRAGSPWVMGLHHCAQARDYDEDDLLIFNEIGQRVADALGSMIMLKNLRESEARYRALTYTASDAIITVDSAGNIVSWNRGAEIIFGYMEAEVNGLPLTMLIPPRYRDRHLAGMDRVLSGGDPHMIGSGAVELEGLRKSGREFPLEISLAKWESADRPFFSGIIRDITERKRAEIALKSESEKNLALLHNASDGIHILDLEGNTIEVSDSFCTMLGYQREEMIGMNVSKWDVMLVTSELPKIISQQYEQRARTQFETRHRRKGGAIFDVEISGFPLELDGKPVMFYSSRDITERKAAEEQIRNLAFYDALTQLPNRRLLNDRLGQTLAASRRSGCYGAMMFLDLDNFKPLNDEYGHAVGDLLLIEVARRIGYCVRETDTVARFGGDEFVVMLSELDQDRGESVAQAGIVAEKIRISLAKPYLLTVESEGGPASVVEHHCTSSIGVVVFVGNEATQEDILKWADMAMYQAKQAGRNRIRFYEAA